MPKITIGFKVEETEKERLERLANSEGLSLSDLIRRMVKKGLEESIFESEINQLKQHLNNKFDIIYQELIWQTVFNEMLSKNMIIDDKMYQDFLDKIRKKTNEKLNK